MNDENKIDLSIEMYEDLKETLVKAIKNAKAGGAGNTGLDNIQLERIERLIEANTLPTTLIIKNNKIVAKAVGLIREETLRALVNQYKA